MKIMPVHVFTKYIKKKKYYNFLMSFTSLIARQNYPDKESNLWTLLIIILKKNFVRKLFKTCYR